MRVPPSSTTSDLRCDGWSRTMGFVIRSTVMKRHTTTINLVDYSVVFREGLSSPRHPQRVTLENRPWKAWAPATFPGHTTAINLVDYSVVFRKGLLSPRHPRCVTLQSRPWKAWALATFPGHTTTINGLLSHFSVCTRCCALGGHGSPFPNQPC